jgi:hypothetical protein
LNDECKAEIFLRQSFFVHEFDFYDSAVMRNSTTPREELKQKWARLMANSAFHEVRALLLFPRDCSTSFVVRHAIV